jgi:hypothetical protein
LLTEGRIAAGARKVLFAKCLSGELLNHMNQL